MTKPSDQQLTMDQFGQQFAKVVAPFGHALAMATTNGQMLCAGQQSEKVLGCEFMVVLASNSEAKLLREWLDERQRAASKKPTLLVPPMS